jgi:ribosome recycling factor
MMPLNQIASVNVPESRTISISVWDQNNVNSVVKAINVSDLGLNPNAEGNVIRINLPDLTEERRKELAKVANGYAEDARIAVRNIRRDGNDSAKRAKNEGELTEDDVHRYGDDIQKLTDDHIKKIDSSLEDKEKDIMTI